MVMSTKTLNMLTEAHTSMELVFHTLVNNIAALRLRHRCEERELWFILKKCRRLLGFVHIDNRFSAANNRIV